MAQIDVTELLTDPDFIDDMQVINRLPQVNSFGENIMSEITINSVGSVQPANGKTIMKLPEEMRVANLMSFWFKGEIVASQPGKYSAILVFKGRRFQVQNVFDWMNWGEGWCEGTCIAEALT